jgi:hypothetical protein
MRASSLWSLALLSPVCLAGCPFHQLRELGVLSDRELELFEAVERDPKVAEELFHAKRDGAHASTANDRSVEKEERELPILGPIMKGVEDMGGGLCKIDTASIIVYQ